MSRRARITDALTEARPIAALLVTACDRAARLADELQRAVEEDVERGVEALPEPSAPPCDHRREHRSGIPAKIDNDPELQAFIRARIDRMTFEQCAAAVAAHFPPERHVRKSAIHDWWRRDRAARKPRLRGGHPEPARSGRGAG